MCNEEGLLVQSNLNVKFTNINFWFYVEQTYVY